MGPFITGAAILLAAFCHGMLLDATVSQPMYQGVALWANSIAMACATLGLVSSLAAGKRSGRTFYLLVLCISVVLYFL